MRKGGECRKIPRNEVVLWGMNKVVLAFSPESTRIFYEI
jgi:hypothetical protein